MMSPTSLIMIHNPATIAMGDHDDMKKAIAMLDEVKESIINAYEIKTSLSRDKLSKLMDAETWMNANKAVELGFADGVLEDEKTVAQIPAYAFSRKKVQAALMNKITARVASHEIRAVGISADKKATAAKVVVAKNAKAPVEPVMAEIAYTEESVKPAGRSVDELKARLLTIKDFI